MKVSVVIHLDDGRAITAEAPIHEIGQRSDFRRAALDASRDVESQLYGEQAWTSGDIFSAIRAFEGKPWGGQPQ